MHIRVSRCLVCGAIALVCAGIATAQTKPPAPAKQPAKAAGLTVEEVIKLVQAGLSEDLIVSLVKKNGKAFDLSAQQVLQLKQASVGDNIIKVMLDPKAEVQPAAAPAPPPAPSPAVMPPELPATAPVDTPPAIPVAAGAGAPVPDENGVYWLKEGRELVRVEGRALSNIRTGSMLTHSMTLGIKRMRINAQLKGPRAETRVREKQPQFYLYLPEDASAGDYLLLRLVQRPDMRQLEIGESRFFKAQAGVDQSKEIEFSQQRIKPRLYLITPKAAMEPGEYGFYPAAGTETKKPVGRIYDFGIDP